jgi:hypothetical protein
MSVATRTDTQSPALRVADGHDLIRVQGARENNPINITQCARCPSLFTHVPRRGVLRRPLPLPHSRTRYPKQVVLLVRPPQGGISYSRYATS